jgi:hypothetical protein
VRCGLILLLGLTGCAVPQPAPGTPGAPVETAAVPVPPIGAELRVGVEFLPPEEGGLGPAPETPRAEPLHAVQGEERPARPVTFVSRRERGLRDRDHLWRMRSEDLASTEQPAARLTLGFVEDLMGEDRRRIEREIGTPVLDPRYEDPTSANLRTSIDEEQAEEEMEAFNQHGIRLLRRPLRNLARRLPPVQSLELALEDFKAENVPLSQAYLEQHPERRNLGRVSIRLRYGIRVATSLENLKLGLVQWVDDDLAIEVQSRCNYETGVWSVRADLVWYASRHTNLRLVVGGNLDFLTTSSVYSLFESPMDGSPGLLLHAVHLF